MALVKLQFCLRRLPALSRDEFQRYWREQHAPLVAAHADVLGIRRYVQRHAVAQPVFQRMGHTRGGLAPYDGVAELWWDGDRRLDAAQAEAARRANQLLLDDERRFIDLPASPIFFVDDHEVVPLR